MCHFIYWTSGEFPFSIMLVCFFTLLYSIMSLPISSFTFLLRLKAVIGSFWKSYLNGLVTGKMFQYLRITLPISDRDRLCVNTSRIFFFCLFVLFLRWLYCCFYANLSSQERHCLKSYIPHSSKYIQNQKTKSIQIPLHIPYILPTFMFFSMWLCFTKSNRWVSCTS